MASVPLLMEISFEDHRFEWCDFPGVAGIGTGNPHAE